MFSELDPSVDDLENLTGSPSCPKIYLLQKNCYKDSIANYYVKLLTDKYTNTR